MRTVSYNELPDEVGLSLGAALMDFTPRGFKTYVNKAGIPIYDGARGYPVIALARFKHMHYTRFKTSKSQFNPYHRGR